MYVLVFGARTSSSQHESDRRPSVAAALRQALAKFEQEIDADMARIFGEERVR